MKTANPAVNKVEQGMRKVETHSFLIMNNGTKEYFRWIDPDGFAHWTKDPFLAMGFNKALNAAIYLIGVHLSACSVIPFPEPGQ